MDGGSVLAKALKDQGVTYMFGIVGIPVIEVGVAAQAAGLTFVGMRNEQAASYAAGAVGYMTRRPGCCLVVSGPGVVHALAGLANAQSNCWPMLLIGGASDIPQDGMGAFQESPQVEFVRPYVKYAAKPQSVERIPFFVEQAVRVAISGRPGPVYLDISGTLVNGAALEEEIYFPLCCPDPPRPLASPDLISKTIELLRTASRPLVIVGKGCAYAHAESEVRRFIEASGLPYLATPMGKGVLPDDHHNSIGAARSTALQRADVILLLSARLNWMLHFGKPPRFAADVKVVQVDISAEEIGNNVPAAVGLVGDVKAVSAQLADAVIASKWKFAPTSAWWTDLRAKIRQNEAVIAEKMADDSEPMSYYRAFKDVVSVLPRDAVIVSEGANTMDIGRTLIKNYLPRHRLDAGTYGTMGVGLGFAIAAAVVHPGKKIVAIEGDSAFGFSGLELEVACRFKLPIVVIIINNNGIYQGLDELPEDMAYAPVTSLTPLARYEKVVEAFGGKGYFVSKPADLLPTLRTAFAQTVPVIVNVAISPSSERKQQEHNWLTRSKL